MLFSLKDEASPLPKWIASPPSAVAEADRNDFSVSPGVNNTIPFKQTIIHQIHKTTPILNTAISFVHNCTSFLHNAIITIQFYLPLSTQCYRIFAH